jgi:hypothetical protein
MSRGLGRWTFVGLALLISGSATYGGVSLIRNGFGMPDGWLSGTPFRSWFWPGAALVGTVAVPQLVAALVVALGRRWARTAGLLAGFGLVAWIVVQLLLLRRFFFLQPVIAGLGLAEIACCSRRPGVDDRIHRDPSRAVEHVQPVEHGQRPAGQPVGLGPRDDGRLTGE